MKIYSYLVFIILMLGFFFDAQANGEIFDNPHHVSGNVLISSKRFKLEQEQLDLKLNAIDYVAKVTYYLSDSGKANNNVAIMYFPVLCSIPQNDESKKKYVIDQCIEKFDVTINGQPVPNEVLMEDEVKKNKTLHALAKKINDRALNNITHTKYDDYPATLAEEASMYVFFKINIPSDLLVKTFAVQYKTKYQQITAATSSSIHTGYEEAHMIYDFFPAAAWMGNENKDLTITLDTSNLQSSLSYNKKQWPFVNNKNEWLLKLHNPDFAKLPPLILATNNGPYQTFINDTQELKKNGTKYSIKVISATPSDSNHNDIKALFDDNPDTFWCWKGKSAILEMLLDPFVISEAEYDSQDKVWRYRTSSFDGLIVLNGAVLNKKTFDNFGLIKKLDATSEYTIPLRVIPKGESDGAELPLPIVANDQDKFQALTILDKTQVARDPKLPFDLKAFTSTTKESQKQIEGKKIFLIIRDVYKKKDTDESCISEIYPIYNGG